MFLWIHLLMTLLIWIPRELVSCISHLIAARIAYWQILWTNGKEKTGQISTYDEMKRLLLSIINPMWICICVSFNSDFPTTGLPQNMNYVRWKSYKLKVVPIVINKRQCNIFYMIVKNQSKYGKKEQWIRRIGFANNRLVTKKIILGELKKN